MERPVAVVVGSCNMDLVVTVDRLPRAGETIDARGFSTAHGGKGANQAVALARMGCAVRMVGRVGADAFGHALRAGLEAEGIDCAHVCEVADEPSGVALITVADGGENTIAVAPGANRRVDVAAVEAAADAFTGAAFLLAQLEIPLATVEASCQRAREAGLRVALDPAPARPLADRLLRLLDYIVPNQTELAALTGLPCRDAAEVQEAARALLRRGPRCVLAKLGGDGSLAVWDGGVARCSAFPAQVVDTVAAGDAFLAGFIAATARGLAVQDALRWGNAAGALAASRSGAQPSLPRLDEVVGLAGADR